MNKSNQLNEKLDQTQLLQIAKKSPLIPKVDQHNTSQVKIFYFFARLPLLIESCFLIFIAGVGYINYWISSNVRSNELEFAFNLALWLLAVGFLIIFRVALVRKLVKAKGAANIQVNTSRISLPFIINQKQKELEIPRSSIQDITLEWYKYRSLNLDSGTGAAGMSNFHAIKFRLLDGREYQITALTASISQLAFVLLSNQYSVYLKRKEALYVTVIHRTLLAITLLVLLVGGYFTWLELAKF
ncbi:hypothetical protein ACUR5C_05485 [Aliikangiella sp. IMCC44653]